MNKFRNFKYLVITLTLTFLVQSCEYEEVTYDGTFNFIQIANDGALDIGESDTAPAITTVQLGSPQSTDTTVSFTVSSDDASRFTVVPSNGQVVIPAGETSADITVAPVPNILVDGDVDVTITLSDSNNLPVGVAGEGNFKKERVITVVDDDCPIDTNGWVGTYSVSEVFTSGTNEGLSLAGAFGEFYQVELTADATDPSGATFILNNSSFANEFLPNGTVLTFRTCPGNVSFSADPLPVALFANMTVESATYNENNFSVTVDGPLGNFGPYQFVFNKQ